MHIVCVNLLNLLTWLSVHEGLGILQWNRSINCCLLYFNFWFSFQWLAEDAGHTGIVTLVFVCLCCEVILNFYFAVLIGCRVLVIRVVHVLSNNVCIKCMNLPLTQFSVCWSSTIGHTVIETLVVATCASVSGSSFSGLHVK